MDQSSKGEKEIEKRLEAAERRPQRLAGRQACYRPFVNPDGVSSRLLAGRYLYRLERRRIVEVAMEGEAIALKSDYFLDIKFLKGLRSEEEVS